ncbi:hypothetical protein F5Y18DRAFT_379701 [Xylariaceae sp. FL1019]|nr:hypothetical protein F5Y18DRAFT_379701 [Xylariaceae sp. FL1019]
MTSLNMGKKHLKRQAAEAEEVLNEPGAASEQPPSKKARKEASRSLFVRSLAPTTTSEALTNFFSQHFPVKHATVVVDTQTKTSKGFGFVTFTDVEDTQAAKEQLQGHKIDGRPIFLDIAESRHRQPGAAADGAAAKKEERKTALAEARKAPKLIVRNLPWSIKRSEQLSALFRSYGLVKYADLPQNKGKLSGFGFITMRGRKNAEAAMEGVNGKVVDGRTLSVDWAVSKDEWNKHHKQEEETVATKEQDAEDVDGSEEADSDDPEEKDDEKVEDEDLRNFMKNHMQNLEEEDSNAEEDEEEEDDDSEDETAEGGAAGAAKPTPQTTDNSSTVFIRNLPFTTTDAELKAHFEQFGRIRYARIVTDRATDRPAGTGFVCFASVDDMKLCLKGAPRPQQSGIPNKKSILQNETADEEGKYTIEGRVLQVSQAVSKDEATRLAESGVAARQGKDQDKRRLYLLSEGIISRESPIFNMLAPSEVKIRDQSAAQRKKLIQGNPTLHISLTRLAVRNMPKNMDSKGLKALAREAIVGFATDVKAGRRQPLSKEELARGGAEEKDAERRRKEKGKGVVKQTKIIYENKEGSKVHELDGASKSRGYGFIEYTSHRCALMGLRWLNGHAVKTDEGKTLRLIVEFAIENAQVVARRRDLQEKNRAGQHAHRGAQTETEKSSGVPKGKDFSVSKGKWQKQKGKGNTDKRNPKDPVKAASENASAHDTLQQKIIGRKRMVRKKKAGARS